jgi:hypothetical protein
MAHGDWALFEGILEGPDNNTRPIDYSRSIYKEDKELGFLEGVERNGHFAARFAGLAQRGADGRWKINVRQFSEAVPSYAVGASPDRSEEWAAIPPPAFRDVFAEFPADDLHEPEGAERQAILAALRERIAPDVNGQATFFNAADPPGTFLVHDGWAYFDGIVEGANGNAQPIDYRNSVYSGQQGSGFRGVLRNNNFAATFRALVEKDATTGTWHVFRPASPDLGAGYAVGKSVWVGDPTSRFAWDIVPVGGNGAPGDGGDGAGGDGAGDGAPGGLGAPGGDGAPGDGAPG